MDWYVVDKEYVKYLKKYDLKIGNVDYEGKHKLYIGIIIEVNSMKYYLPISSFKTKHKSMFNKIDFHKIENKETGQAYAVANINNMIPVPDKYITKFKYNEIEKYRKFNNKREKMSYIHLLQKEMLIINEIHQTLVDKAQKVYNKCRENPESNLAKRCCKFTLLEDRGKVYEKGKS